MSRPLSIDEHTFINYLYAARQQPIGIILRTNDVRRLESKLRSAKQSAGDPALQELQIIPWGHPDGDLIIVNRHIMVQR